MAKQEPRVPVHGDPGHWIHTSQSPRQVRVVFGGETIAESKRVQLLREDGVLPVYYFPRQDVRMNLLLPTEHKSSCPYKGEASYWTARSGARVAENAAWSYVNPLPEAVGIRECIAFYWNQMDAWYEEEEQVFAHARDPYKRVDVLPSSRHVRIVLGGLTIVDTRRPQLVLETGMPIRYYIPEQDVQMELLEPTETTTRCAYKGKATYWSATIGERVFKNIVWSYR